MEKSTELPQPLLPLQSSGLTLETVGGKAINLSRLSRAGFPVPAAFFVPTSCYLDFVRYNAIGEVIQTTLHALDTASPQALNRASSTIRDAFTAGEMSGELKTALVKGWAGLGNTPVAIRSSATAEDLPQASFAGQQDTFLNVVSEEAILRAVVDCWSSLWTPRAISYRAKNQVPNQGIALCVIVQQMVPADASGVMFTANPLTGQRNQVVINATLGLGEALVSGQVSPDTYLVAAKRTHRQEDRGKFSSHGRYQLQIEQKTLGSKNHVTTPALHGSVDLQPLDAADIQALPDQAILQLGQLGVEISHLYGEPQDIEWAWTKGGSSDLEDLDQDGELFILQSRPVTSLFPLPKNLDRQIPRFLVGFHTVQGVMAPITPLGQDTLKLFFAGAGKRFGVKTTLETQAVLFSAAERLWINFTPLLHSSLGRKIFSRLIREIDPGVAAVVTEIKTLPQFSPKRRVPSLKTFWRIFRFVLPVLIRVPKNLGNPDRARQDVLDAFDRKITRTADRIHPSGDHWTGFQHSLALLQDAETIFADFVIPMGIPPIMAAMAPFFGLVTRYSEQAAAAQQDPAINALRLEIARGLPHNVTTEMDLALWQIAVRLKADLRIETIFQSASAQQLSLAFRRQELPSLVQKLITEFLARYGDRGPGEIDLGKARWSEDPTPVMSALQSYLKIEDPQMAPHTVFSRGASEAQAAAEALSAAVIQLPFGGLKSRLLRFAVSRYRALAGMREAPKFFAVRMLGLIRRSLLASGGAMAAAGNLERADDLFFLQMSELNQIAEAREIPEAFLALIKTRRRSYNREMERSRLPLVLLNDGTTIYPGASSPRAGDTDTASAILGDPVSAGTAEGRVRVVLNPQQADLEPGEILVCPGTDPSWTPLFLAAGGLVMEVGGLMTHGSVVAREYGIPAVVGVHHATTRLKTGTRIRLNGSTGVIHILDP